MEKNQEHKYLIITENKLKKINYTILKNTM